MLNLLIKKNNPLANGCNIALLQMLYAIAD